MADDSTSAKPAWWVRAEKNIIRTHGLKGPHLHFFSDDAKRGAQVALSPSVSEAEDDAAVKAAVEACLKDDGEVSAEELAFITRYSEVIIAAFLRARAESLGVKQE